MKKALIACLAMLCIACMAEYQVFDYSASIKYPVYNESKGNIAGAKLVSDKLKGYLVTVCCYPCGANFGKDYPSWLFVVRDKDPNKRLWKIPVKVDGGLFGKKINSVMLWDQYEKDGWVHTNKLKTLAKRGNKSWFFMYAKTKQTSFSKPTLAEYLDMPFGFLGWNNTTVELFHYGLGSGDVKTNMNIEPWVNPYLKQVSGNIGGTFDRAGFSFDPSNFRAHDEGAFTGTFIIRFNKKRTEELRGTADWEVLSDRIMQHMKFKDVVSEPEPEDIYELGW